MSLKHIIKKIPVLNSWAKIRYDESREKKKTRQISKFLSCDLPYVNKVPASFGVGHEPTIRCNLNCKMCYQAGTRLERREELSTEEVLEIYKKLEGKINEIKIVGGEPFMRADILELVKFWDERQTPVALQTNLTLVTESMIDRLKKFKNIKAFLTSLDGPDKVHNMIRGVPNAFERMIEAVKRIHKEMPWVEVSIFSTMLVQDNLDSLYQVCDIAQGLNIGSVQVLFEQVNTSQDVAEAEELLNKKLGWPKSSYRINTQVRDGLFGRVDPAQLKDRLDKIRTYGMKRKCFINFTPYNFYKNLETYLGLKNKSPYLFKMPCRPTVGTNGKLNSSDGVKYSIGRCGDKKIFCLKLLAPELRIVQTGDVVWCDIIEKSFGNLVRQPLEEIWLSKEYQAFRKFLKNGALPVCRRCCKAFYID